MNILYLLDFFPKTSKGGDELAGGVESRYFYLVEELRKRGHTVSVIARSGLLTEVAKSYQPNIFDRLFIFQWRAIKEGLAIDFDVVEGGSWITYFAAYMLGKLKRKPVVFCYHDVAIGKWSMLFGKLGFIGELGERFILALRPDAFVAVSESTKEALIQNGVVASRVRVVHNGVSYQDLAKVKVAGKKYDICCVARLVPYKNVADLLAAIAKLIKRHPKLSVAIVGQGPQENELKKLATKLGISKLVDFKGHLPSHLDVLRLIKSSKIFCLPSSFEGFGISVIEAQALGVPVVVSDIPALKEVSQNGKAGVVFKLGDTKELALKLENLLHDQKLSQSLQIEGRKSAQRYSWPVLARRLSILYENLRTH